MLDTLKDRVYDTLDFEETADTLEWTVTIFLVGLIILNVIVAVLATAEELNHQCSEYFVLIEEVALVIFTVEYGLRAWSITANPTYADPVMGRLLYLLTPMAFIDFIAIFPSYLVFYTNKQYL